MLQPVHNGKNNRLKKAAAISSVVLSIVLMFLKLYAALYTGSLAILSSLVDSVSDIFASVITFVAVRFSSQPATHKHRYGFGKAEALSALMQSAFIAGSGIFVIYEGINRAINPYPLTDTVLGIAIMIISMILTVMVVAFQQYVVRRTSSLAVGADSMHYMVDIFTNALIIFSLVVVKWLHIDWFDTVGAILVSGYLLFYAAKIANEAIGLLLDKELSAEVRGLIVDIVKKSGFCHGVHDLRTRNLGGEYIFELHLELDGDLSLYEAHCRTELIENEIKKHYPHSQIIIHQDPAGVEEDRLDNHLID